MKYSYILVGLTASMLLVTSCKKQAYYDVNPNTPSTATPALLLAGICNDVFYYGVSSITEPAYATRQVTYYQDANDVNETYGWSQGSYNNYITLEQVQDMNTRAIASGQVTYQALAHFFRAVLFSQLTEMFGDVPYSQALGALTGTQTPKYDTQQDIYAGILQELDTANNMLTNSQGTINGDIIYGASANPIAEWQQLINAFKLRLLIHLSKKTGTSSINIIQQFQNIVNNPSQYPLMTSNNDNCQLVFNTTAISNYYPDYENLTIQTSVSLEQGFTDTLLTKNDPRLFSFASPVSGDPAGVFSSYLGVNAGLTLADQQTASAGASRLNDNYWTNPVNIPYIFLGYAEQEFVMAEAAARGWITGNAATYYNNGITASMTFYGIDAGTITTYLTQSNVQFNSASAIPMILTQKQIAFFYNSGWEPFFEQRRTGIPTMDVGPGTLNNEQVPQRWMYPQNEYAINATNVNAAVASQYGGNDNINGVMWVLQ